MKVILLAVMCGKEKKMKKKKMKTVPKYLSVVLLKNPLVGERLFEWSARSVN